MKTLVEPGDSFEKWHQVTCRSYSVTQCANAPGGAAFRARVSQRGLGALALNEIESKLPGAATIRVTRGATDIRRDPRDDFFLWFALGGNTRFSQDERRVSMRPGDMVLHDQSRPFSLEFGEWSHAVMVAIPRALLTSRIGAADEFVARPVGRDAKLAALAGSVLQQLMALHDDAPPALAQAAMDIWSTALEAELAPSQVEAGARDGRLAAVKRYLRARLGDPALDGETIARDCHLSLRTLMRLFAAEGTTPGRWLWQQRLEASYRALAEGRVRQVSQAALEFGFTDLSHFSRAFKARFGRSPKDVQGKGG